MGSCRWKMSNKSQNVTKNRYICIMLSWRTLRPNALEYALHWAKSVQQTSVQKGELRWKCTRWKRNHSSHMRFFSCYTHNNQSVFDLMHCTMHNELCTVENEFWGDQRSKDVRHPISQYHHKPKAMQKSSEKSKFQSWTPNAPFPNRALCIFLHSYCSIPSIDLSFVVRIPFDSLKANDGFA